MDLGVADLTIAGPLLLVLFLFCVDLWTALELSPWCCGPVLSESVWSLCLRTASVSCIACCLDCASFLLRMVLAKGCGLHLLLSQKLKCLTPL